MLSSTNLKPVVGALPEGPEPNGSQSKVPSLPMLKLNRTLIPSLQLKGKEELPLQKTSAAAVSRRELIGLAGTTVGGLALLFATEPAEALEVADIGSSIKDLLGIFKGKPKTGAGDEKNPKVEDGKKPKSEGDVKKPKVEDNGKKPKSETDEKKPKVEGHGNKPKNEADEKKHKVEAELKKAKDGDDKKASTPHHSEKVSSFVPSLPNLLNSVVP